MTDLDGERRVLFVALSVLTVAATGALLIWRRAPIASTWAIAGVSTPFVVSSLVLWLRRDTYGWEGRYLDYWSVPHFFAGGALGLLGLELSWTLALVVWWELVELMSRVREYPTNRVTDVALAIVAWACAQGAWHGGFPVW